MLEAIKAFFGLTTTADKTIILDPSYEKVTVLKDISAELASSKMTLETLNHYDTSKTGRVVPVDILVQLYLKTLEFELKFDDVYLSMEAVISDPKEDIKK